jgi:hypothetical protein
MICFLAIGLMVGLQAAHGWATRRGGLGRVRRLLVPGVVAAMLTMQAWPLYAMFARRFEETRYQSSEGPRSYRLLFYDETWRSHESALDWLGTVAEPGEVIGTSTPHWAYIRNGLTAVMPPFEADLELAQTQVDAVPLRYLVVDDLEFTDVTRRYALPMVQAHPNLWELVHGEPDMGSRVYRRRG